MEYLNRTTTGDNMNQTAKLKWLSYPEDKQAIAEKKGYTDFYSMLLGEYEKNKNAHEIGKIAQMSYVQVNKLLRALGAKIRPRGGRNNAVIPEHFVKEIRSHKILTRKLKCKYAGMFLCDPKTVYDNWKRDRRGEYVRGSVQQEAELNRNKYDKSGREI